MQYSIEGAATAGPSNPSLTFPSLSGAISLSLQQDRNAGRTQEYRLNVVAPSFQDLLAGITISAIRLVVIRVMSGSIVVRFSSSTAADQLLPVSDLFVISNPLAGSQLTALAVQGSAQIELMIAGDPP